MKENAPEKMYISPTSFEVGEAFTSILTSKSKEDIEYTRTDAFIEKACEFLKSYRQEIYNGESYIAGIVNDKTIEDFRKYMEE